LEAAVKLLTNPIMLRMALVFVAGAFAFLLGAVLIRKMRKSLLTEASFSGAASLDMLPLHTYQAVIQELKQQKHELQSQQHEERRRAKTSENISAVVLSNLSSGVLFVGSNGLVRQANTAARQILGFGSLAGMSLAEVFREARVVPNLESSATLASLIETSLREKTPFRRLEGSYVTPAGEERILDVTVTPVRAPGGDVLGASCVINDQSELAHIRQLQELRGEISGEMALELHNSLATILLCARQITTDGDPEISQRLAADIAAEAERLEHKIGGFLANASSAGASAGV
jgi:PAS domain S-box-containing protein